MGGGGTSRVKSAGKVNPRRMYYTIDALNYTGFRFVCETRYS